MTSPAMPSPKRVATSSIRLLRRMGFTKHQAAVLVFQICLSVAHRMEAEGITDINWIDEVGTHAMEHTTIYRQQATIRGDGK